MSRCNGRILEDDVISRLAADCHQGLAKSEVF
jgi:hypothetical protein